MGLAARLSTSIPPTLLPFFGPNASQAAPKAGNPGPGDGRAAVISDEIDGRVYFFYWNINTHTLQLSACCLGGRRLQPLPPAGMMPPLSRARNPNVWSLRADRSNSR